MALAVAEIYLRLVFDYETADTLRKKSLQYESTLFSRHAFPQMVQTYTKNWAMGAGRVNSRGYRGQEFTMSKAPGTIRIVFLGGSAVFDIGASDGQDWPHLVEKELQSQGFKQVEVINAGTPGHATWDALGRLYSEIWMFEPDYVVVYEAWNDIKYFKQLSPEQSLLRTYRPPKTHQDGQRRMIGNPYLYYTGSLDRFLSHSQLYNRLRNRYWSWQQGRVGLEGLVPDRSSEKPNTNFYLSTYSEWGPRQYELNLHLIVRAAQLIGATPVLLTQVRLPEATNNSTEEAKINYDYVDLSHEALVQAFTDCDQAIFNVAQTEKVPMLDLSSRFSGRTDFFIDHVHTTPVGSEVIAKHVAEFLAEIIKE